MNANYNRSRLQVRDGNQYTTRSGQVLTVKMSRDWVPYSLPQGGTPMHEFDEAGRCLTPDHPHMDLVEEAAPPKRRAPREFRWGPAHFPVGTVFTLNEDIAQSHIREGRVNEWPVQGVVRNGVDSYVLDTGVTHKFLDGSEHEHSFNISHVASIVKRGTGPVGLDPGGYGLKTNQDLHVDIQLAESSRFLASKRRGYHTTYSPRYFIAHEVQRTGKLNATLDLDGLVGAVLEQTWSVCKAVPGYEGLGLRVWEINRKRLRRWVAQNVNRFLQNIRRAAVEEERENWDRHQEDLGGEGSEEYNFDPIMAGFSSVVTLTDVIELNHPVVANFEGREIRASGIVDVRLDPEFNLILSFDLDAFPAEESGSMFAALLVAPKYRDTIRMGQYVVQYPYDGLIWTCVLEAEDYHQLVSARGGEAEAPTPARTRVVCGHASEADEEPPFSPELSEGGAEVSRDGR